MPRKTTTDSAIHDEHLTETSPDESTQESSLESGYGDPDSPDYDELLAQENAKLKQELDALREAQRRAARQKALQAQCLPTRITARINTNDASAIYAHPALDMDLKVIPATEDSPARVLIPVPIWPAALPDPKTPYWTREDGTRVPNLNIGQTQINESLCTAQVTMPDGTVQDVSISGFARLTVNMAGPSKVADRISESELRLIRSRTAADGDNPNEEAFHPSTAATDSTEKDWANA